MKTDIVDVDKIINKVNYQHSWCSHCELSRRPSIHARISIHTFNSISEFLDPDSNSASRIEAWTSYGLCPFLVKYLSAELVKWMFVDADSLSSL